MADFRPETAIFLYQGCGVDDENQPFFTTESGKMGWYAAHPSRSFTQYSYQRENREYIRVDAKAEDLRRYDMLTFKNGEGRNIICRIEAVEFINPNCAEITYSVDYMQTYIETIQFGPCWVEREMQQNDWNGSDPSFNNLQPEGIETGKMTRTRVGAANEALSFKSFDLVVISAYDNQGDPIYEVNAHGNYPSGLNVFKYRISEGKIAGISNLLERYQAKGIDISTAIVGMYVVPSEYSGGQIYSKTATVSPLWPVVNGYKPVNAKCFTSEFCTLEVSNRRGNSMEYKPENFTETDNIILILKANQGYGNGGSMVYPQSYEGKPEDFGVVKYDDVQSPFVSNAYASWQAAHIAEIGTDILTSAVSGGVKGAAVGSVVPGVGTTGGAIAGMVGGVFQSIAPLIDKAKDPAAIGGQSSGSVLELLFENYGYSVNWVHPYSQNLKSIDEFFGRFGYRTNRFKVPNVDTRPKWNYVKTSGAVCRGPFSKRAQLYMERLMNQGVTFWHLGAGQNITDDWTIEENKE